MNAVRDWKHRLARVSALRDAGEPDAALAEVEAMLDMWPGNPRLHVLRAELIQLQERPTHELPEAAASLRRAAELDPNGPAAAIELGHYLDNVEDDPRAAVKAFADGTAAARRLLIDGLIGQAKAFRQLDKAAEFRRCVAELLHLTGNGAARPVPGERQQVEQLQELLGELVTERTS